jgi:hypothetical protein
MWYLRKNGSTTYATNSASASSLLLGSVPDKVHILKGLSHEIDFKNVDENGQILSLIRAAAGF